MKLVSAKGTAGLSAHHALRAIRLRTGIGNTIVLAVEADDEHRPPVAVAAGLIVSEDRRRVALRSDVSDALAKAAMAKLIGAAKKIDGVIGVERSETRLHGAVVLVAEGQDVRPHA